MSTKFYLQLSVLAFGLMSSSLVFAQTATQSDAKSTAKTEAQTQKSTQTTSAPAGAKEKDAVATPTATQKKPADVVPATKATPESSAAQSPESTEKTKSPTKPVVVDPIVTLREQIAAAPVEEKLDLQFQLVNLLSARGKAEDAINELHTMTGLDVFDPSGFYNIGNALARFGDAEGATNAYQKAIAQKKGKYSRAFNNLGVIQMRRGRWDEAYQAFLSALRLEDFHYAEASYNLGRLYAARGEMDLAIHEWHRTLTINPDHTAAAQALATAGSSEQITIASIPKNPPAEKHYTAKPTRQPVTNSVKPVAVNSTTTLPRPGSSIRRLAVDADTYGYLQRARSAREADKQEEAVANYRRVISRMGGYFGPANLEMSYALLNLKRPDDAMTNLLAVARNDGAHYPIVYYHLARLYEARGDYKMAEESFSLAAKSSKDNPQFLLDVSRVRERLGDVQGALSALEEYLAVMERQHLKPDWSIDRLAALRQRLTTTPAKP